MPITRAQLLRRALVGGAVIVFGELPELAAKIPEASASGITRTAIPTTARMCRIEWLEDELMPGYTHEILRERGLLGPVSIHSTPQESGEIPWRVGNADPNLVLLTAQAVKWEKTTKGIPPVTLSENLRRAAVLPPQAGRHFTTDDIVRSSHDGDCFLVRGKLAPDTLELQHIGFTIHDAPLTDGAAEAAELAKLLPHGSDTREAEILEPPGTNKPEMWTFERYAESEHGRTIGYDRW